MSSDVWQIETRTSESDLTSDDYCEVRNITGSAAVSVAQGLGGIAPGVIRHTVTDVTGGIVTLTGSVYRVEDLKHEFSGDTWTVALGGTTTYGITVSATAAEGDVFDVGIGCYYDTDEATWVSTRSVGIVAPGYSGQTVFVSITNISDRDRVQAALTWDNNGTSLFWARQSGGEWVSPEQGVLYLSGTLGTTGLVQAGETVEIELRPVVPEDATAENNMVVAAINISSSYV